jgi:hypothetical protein
MRRIRSETEHSKLEISTHKKAARGFRDKMADFHRLTLQLETAEKKQLDTLEEVGILRISLRESQELVETLQNDQNLILLGNELQVLKVRVRIRVRVISFSLSLSLSL